jgi:ribonuclease HI
VSSWPSSSHAEVIAIFTALLTAPSYCKVKINTDSQTCIDTFKYIMSRCLTIRQWLRINNHFIWLMILETIKTKNLSVLFFKVKAHSGVIFNEQVDRLAKNALSLEPIQFNVIDTGPLFVIPTWDIFSVDINTRNFIKQMHKYINLYAWKNQNRIRKLLTDDPSDQSSSDWQLAWKRLSIRNYYTSIKQSHKRSFLFKLIHNELPSCN